MRSSFCLKRNQTDLCSKCGETEEVLVFSLTSTWENPLCICNADQAQSDSGHRWRFWYSNTQLESWHHSTHERGLSYLRGGCECDALSGVAMLCKSLHSLNFLLRYLSLTRQMLRKSLQTLNFLLRQLSLTCICWHFASGGGLWSRNLRSRSFKACLIFFCHF